VFRMILRTNSDYFPIQHQQIGLCYAAFLYRIVINDLQIFITKMLDILTEVKFTPLVKKSLKVQKRSLRQ
jgi:hypothetical protein